MNVGTNNTAVNNHTRFKDKIWGAIPALGAVGYVSYDVLHKSTDKEAQSVKNFLNLVSPDVDSFEKINEYAQKAMEETGLTSKGVVLTTVNKENIKEVETELVNALKNEPLGKRTAQKFAKYFEHGINAAFEPNLKKIYISESNLYSSVFHEMGHALNNTSTKFWKFMQKARILSPNGIPVIGATCFVFGLFHNKKNCNEGEKKPFTEKIKDFVKDRAGTITLLTILPMLAEEAEASNKGLKIAEKYLNKSQLERLSKNYKHMYLTYLSLLIVPAAIGLGGIINDMSGKKKKNSDKKNIMDMTIGEIASSAVKDVKKDLKYSVERLAPNKVNNFDNIKNNGPASSAFDKFSVGV